MLNPILNLAQRVARRYTRVPVDATKHPAEQYYADLYLDVILRRLSDLGGKPLKVLDAGCGAGRLMTPIAQQGHHLTGIDYHRDSLRLARENLDAVGARFELIEADLADALARFPDGGFDAAMAIESLYVSEQFEAILDHLVRVLRPGGLLFITHRTRFYYLTKALADGHFDDAAVVARNPNGRLRKGMHRVYHHWQTRNQIGQACTSRGMELLSLQGIGVCSGFGEDALSKVCDPGQLDEAQRAVLREIETCDDDLLMTGRYVLAVARKPG